MKKRKVTALLTISFLLAAQLTGCGNGGSESASASDGSASSEAESESEEDPIKVGILYSTTGDWSISETPMQNAAQMAVDEINEAGGIDGRQIEAVVADYGSDAAMAAERAQEMILEDEVCAIVGTNTSATREAVVPIIEQYDSLLIYNTFYEGGTPSDNVLYTNTSPSQQIKDYIPWIMENLGTKIFFVGTDYEFPRISIEYAKELVEENGGEVCGEEYTTTDATDFSSVINKIKQADPDVVFSVVAGNSIVPFYKQYTQYGMDPEEVPICSTAAHEGAVAGAGEASVGTYSSFGYFNTIDTEANQEFVSNYIEKFGTDTTVTNSAEAAYHGVYLLKEAIEAAGGSLETEDIVEAAAGLEWDTPAGTLKMDESNHNTWLHSYIGKVNEDLEFDIVYESDGLVEPEPEL
ncbi:MAG: transporter substrate-binding domain-containing protein [Ruminococcus sp.]|jgi:urea transport system substrate-binding protein